MRTRVVFTIILGLLSVQLLMLNYSARKHSPTWDETGYLVAGLSHWELGRFDLYSVNPPLVRTVAAAPVYFFSDYKIDWDGYRSDPAVRSEVFVGRRFMELNGTNALQYFYLARLAVLPFAFLGTWLCFAWGRELFGIGAGLLAAAIWVFSPFVLAHGALITPDLPSAVTMLAASLAFWKWLESPSYSRAGVFAAAVAVAMLTKSVWLVLPVLFFVTGSTYLAIRGRVHQFQASGSVADHVGKQGGAWQAWGQLVGAMLLAILLANAFYGFASSGKPLGDFQFVSRAFAGPGDCEDCSAQPGNRFAGSWSGKLPVPLPANYLQGIDVQRRDFERGRFDPAWKSYLWGEWKQGGWWYYYLVGLAAKLPLPIIALVVAGAIVIATRFCARPSYRVASTKWAFCVLFLPAMVLLILLIANSGLNRYVRYAIPVLPVLFIVAGAAASMVNVKRRWHVVGIAIPLVWLVAISLSTSPHWLSYFNPIAGGPANGQRVLCDSNIDWGQDLLLLQEWLNKNPQAKEDLHLAYFGSFDPVAMGIPFSLPRPFLSLGTPGDNELTSANSLRSSSSDRLRPGWYVISKNYVVGHPISLPDGSGKPRFRYYGESAFSYFSALAPVDRIGNSMLVYRVPQYSDDSQLVPLQGLRTQLVSTSQ